jgi:hypothetical protein
MVSTNRAGMVCGCWSAWDWYRNQCPVGVAYTELADQWGPAKAATEVR